jgi:hypothetical protein
MRRAGLLVAIVSTILPAPARSQALPPNVAESDKDRFVFGDYVFEDDYKKLSTAYGKPLDSKIRAVVTSDPVVSSLAASFEVTLRSATNAAVLDATKSAAKLDERITAELRELRKARDAAIARGDEVEILAAQMALWDARERGLGELTTLAAVVVAKRAPLDPELDDVAIDKAAKSVATTLAAKAKTQSKELSATIRRGVRLHLEQTWMVDLRVWKADAIDAAVAPFRVKWLALVKK